jgi:ribonuclease HII
MLCQNPNENILYASLDEVGRGSLAGSVVAACVIWKPGPKDDMINDSKKLSKKKRQELAEYIMENAIDYSICFVDNERIDRVNILNSTMEAMHSCLDTLKVDFDEVLVDGNYFRKYKDKKHTCIVEGDAKYVSIAAASILAKEARDEYMKDLSLQYPVYKWDKNAGYGTREHILAIIEHGATPYHRKTFLKSYI